MCAPLQRRSAQAFSGQGEDHARRLSRAKHRLQGPRIASGPFVTTVTDVEEQSVTLLTGYPNPVISIIHIPNLNSYSEAIVHDSHGQTHLKVSITPGTEALDLEALPRGFYVLSLWKHGQVDRLKVVKE